MCLAQEYIDISREYRVIYLNGEYQFSYEKNIDNAKYIGNLSPFHWNGAKAILVKDKETINRIKKFCTPIFDHLAIPFCGLDIAVDKENQIWVIEVNSSPGFDSIIQYEGQEIVVKLYQNISVPDKNLIEFV